MPASGAAVHGSFQLFDFRELTCSHFLHQLQDRFLLGFANLDELHEPEISR